MDFQLNEDSLIPLYQQLMEDIKAALTEGKYAPAQSAKPKGRKLPPHGQWMGRP